MGNIGSLSDAYWGRYATYCTEAIHHLAASLPDGEDGRYDDDHQADDVSDTWEVGGNREGGGRRNRRWEG